MKVLPFLGVSMEVEWACVHFSSLSLSHLGSNTSLGTWTRSVERIEKGRVTQKWMSIATSWEMRNLLMEGTV